LKSGANFPASEFTSLRRPATIPEQRHDGTHGTGDQSGKPELADSSWRFDLVLNPDWSWSCSNVSKRLQRFNFVKISSGQR
jgi:hypothetical protein